MGNRITFLIDGFNVYHSIKTAIKHSGIAGLKWLNCQQMCQSFVSDVIHLQGGTLESVYYFTALARHAGADVVLRHKLYIEAMESTGVTTVQGNFKKKGESIYLLPYSFRIGSDWLVRQNLRSV